MTRHESRELAFILLFEKLFTESTVEEILLHAGEARNVEADSFAVSLASGAVDNLETIDEIISRHSTKWSQKQMSRVSLSVMRLAVYEMMYLTDIPVSVSINEAVELAKVYGGDEDASFINGVLGGIARNENTVEESAADEASV